MAASQHYYCRYCQESWPLSFFRNSQQFGAHCSNCSRRAKEQNCPTIIEGFLFYCIES